MPTSMSRDLVDECPLSIFRQQDGFASQQNMDEGGYAGTVEEGRYYEGILAAYCFHGA